MKIAVVAYVQLHDLYGGYGWLEEGSGDIALRTLEDTMASISVFPLCLSLRVPERCYPLEHIL